MTELSLVERLRQNAEMLKDGYQTNLTELWHSEVVRDAAKDAVEAANEIVRLRALAQPSWQPIETAPKDRFILLYCPEDQSRWLAKWQGNDRWYGCDIEHGLTREGYSAGDPDVVTGWAITHWMDAPPPLPSPLLTPARGGGG